jgi:uncharacterized integral membrane protein
MNDPTKASRDSGNSGAGFDLKKWGIGALVVLFLIVVFQNAQEARIDFLFFSVTMPLIVVLLISALVGLVVGYALAAWRRRGPKG